MAGIEAIRQKGIALASYLIELADEQLAPLGVGWAHRGRRPAAAPTSRSPTPTPSGSAGR